MIKQMRKKIFRVITNQDGVSLILALVILFFGVLVVTSLLSFMATGLKTSHNVFDVKTNQLYAADAGITDGTWQIKYDNISTFNNPMDYSPYDYSSSWAYTIINPTPTPTPNTAIADHKVDVTVNNVWIPEGIGPPDDPDDAKILIEGVTGIPSVPPKININSSITSPGTIEIKIQYRPEAGDADLMITTLGIWLPPGYTFVPNNTYFQNADLSSSAYKGGTAIIWDFGSGYPFYEDAGTHFPGVNIDPKSPSAPLVSVSNITFQYTASSTNLSPPVAWLNTNLPLSPNGVTYTWDGNIRTYHINSVASTLGDSSPATEVNAYFSKYVSTATSTSIAGDYCMTGGSLMIDSNINDNQRDSLKSESTNTILLREGNDTSSKKLPADASISSATLYWSGWLNQSRSNAVRTLYDDFSKWGQTSNNWTGNRSYIPFTGHYNSGNNDSRYLTLLENVYLDDSYQYTLSWDQQNNTYSGTPTPTPVPPLNPDNCNSLNNFNSNWNPGTSPAWSYNSGNYKGAGNTSNKDLTLKNPLNLNTYGTTGNITISLESPVLGPTPTPTPVSPLNPDMCSTFTNWNYGSAWGLNSVNFKGGGPNSGKDLTLKSNTLNLSTYGTTGTIAVSLDNPILANPTTTNVSPLNPDQCTSFSNWTAGSNWSVSNSRFRGNCNNGSGTTLTLRNGLPLASYGSIGNVTISWDQESSNMGNDRGIDVAYSTDGNNYTTFASLRGNISSHANYSLSNLSLTNNFKIRFTTVGSGSSNRYWYIDNINVAVTPVYSTSDGLDFSFSLDGGTSWSTGQVFRGTGSPNTNFIIPNVTLPTNFLIRFSLVGLNASWQFCTIDNIYVRVNTQVYSSSDGLNMSYSLNGGSSWTTNQVFRGTGSPNTSFTIPNVTLPTNFLVRFSLVGFNYAWQYCTIDNIRLTVTPTHTETDALLFSFYDGFDRIWSENLAITSPYTIPASYLNANFKMRLYLQGFSFPNESCEVDNIALTRDSGLLPSDDSVNFTINTSPSIEITVDPYDSQEVVSKQTINSNGQRDGFYYACRKDVTDLVKQYSTGANYSASPKIDGYGAGTYTISNVNADVLGRPEGATGTDGNESYAGWSLVIIYSNPGTQGNYLKLYDWNDWPDSFSVPSNLFDAQGHSIATEFDIPVTGFTVPKQIKNAVLAIEVTSHGSGYISAPGVSIEGGGGSGAVATANISGGQVQSISIINGGQDYTSTPTVTITGGGGSGASATAGNLGDIGDEVDVAKFSIFVGEGDPQITGDYIALIDQTDTTQHKLWDGVTINSPYTNNQGNPTNVWNSQSSEFPSDAGVDLDTFHIKWVDNWLNENDSSAKIHFYTHGDGYVLINMIVSFRSLPSTGGSLVYTIP